MRIVKLGFFFVIVFSVASIYAINVKVMNNTGNDLNLITLYNSGAKTVGDCISSEGTFQVNSDPLNQGSGNIDISQNGIDGKVSGVFLARYPSKNGTCNDKPSDQVSYSNLVSFNVDDINTNKTSIRYRPFSSTGLNMTPVVIFNPQSEILATYTGHRQGDSGKGSYGYYNPKKSIKSFDNGSDNNGYNSSAMVSNNQELILY
ncbi:hypothetical protein OAO18_03910 [Francisellaceae bacterium]|nr:hypothetical protein [Francisellaceae bacterium]